MKMSNNLFRKGLVLGIIILFIGAGVVPTISGYANKKNKRELIEVNSYNKGEVDLIIEGSGWWSPAPWDENRDYISYHCRVYNVGERYNRRASIDVGMYLIYPDEEVYYHIIGCAVSGLHIGLITGTSHKDIIHEKPEDIRFEVETDVSESNTENNDFTVTVDNGVTIYGAIYRRSLSGELYPELWGFLDCNSDVSPLDFRYGATSHPYGNYVLTAPKKAGVLPFRYTVIAEIEFPLRRYKIKLSPPLNEFEYTEIDFIFDSVFNMNNEELISNFQQSQTTQQTTSQQTSTIQQTQTTRLQTVRSNFLNRLFRR